MPSTRERSRGSSTPRDPFRPHERTAGPSPLPMLVTEGKAHAVRFANSAFAKRWGGAPPSLVAPHGGDVTGLFADAHALRAELDRAYEGCVARMVVADDALLAARDGGRALRGATVVATPVLDEHGSARGLVLLILEQGQRVAPDVATQAPAREAALREANEKLILAGLREQELAERANRHAGEVTALLENMTEGVTVFDATGEVALVNERGRAIFGFECKTCSIADYRRARFCTTDGARVDFEKDVLARMLRGERFTEEEVILHRPDGKLRNIVWGASAVRDVRGQVSLAIKVYRDVTALRELEHLREQDISLISHDLRGPLSAARMAAYMITNEPECPPKIQGIVRRLVKSLERQDGMLADLLDVFRIRAGEPLSVRFEECDLYGLARETVDDLELVHGKRFVLVGDESVHGLWSGDQLRRAIWNLASNAVKYGSSHTPVVVSVARTAGRAQVTVHNDGEPIPVDSLPRLFRPFSRGADMLTHGPRGWGLGLTLVRGCAEAHGGTVRVESDAVAGTTFTLELPLDARAALGNHAEV